jgi:hypothetical protein
MEDRPKPTRGIPFDTANTDRRPGGFSGQRNNWIAVSQFGQTITPT